MDIINWDSFLLPYRQAVDELVVKLNATADEFRNARLHSPIESVYGRVKRVSSILDKASRKGVPLSDIGDKIEDIAGVRIICCFVEDIEKVLEILHKRDGFDIEIKEERDYIGRVKPSGYQSYHVLFRYSVMTMGAPKEIWAEALIRTLAMNFWATIEHSLKYKYSGNIPLDVQAHLKDSAIAASRLDRQMSKIRHEITEAQEVDLVRNDLVDSIVEKLQSLYLHAKLEQVNELNREFIDIYQEKNVQDLISFSEKINTFARIYRVEHL